jgi:NRAMP (natural resistance-associated macrophage protein)-like metal ion transporter
VSDNLVKRFLSKLGPGFITGASDDDPSGIGTYAAAGAASGFSLLWIALVTYPMMSTVQGICARIGLVTGQGLSGVIKTHYSKKLLLPVVVALVIANTLNAGADIGAIAAAINLLTPIPIVWMIVPVGVGILLLQLIGTYRFIERVFKWLALALLAYIGSAFFSKPDWPQVLHGTFVPTMHFDGKSIAMLVALLGTTISPYLFFFQASQEVEKEISIGRKELVQREGVTDEELRYSEWDVNFGMFFSNVAMYFIILATGATLFESGQHDITSAAQAAQALTPLAGRSASMLFAMGLIGSGILAVPILTGSGAYAVCEALGWNRGLDELVINAKAYYGVIAASTLVGLLINFVGINPIAALFWTAVINGILSPPLLVLIMLISNNSKVMGTHVNGRWANLVGWGTAIVMSVAAIGLFVTWKS